MDAGPGVAPPPVPAAKPCDRKGTKKRRQRPTKRQMEARLAKKGVPLARGKLLSRPFFLVTYSLAGCGVLL